MIALSGMGRLFIRSTLNAAGASQCLVTLFVNKKEQAGSRMVGRLIVKQLNEFPKRQTYTFHGFRIHEREELVATAASESTY